MKRSPLLVGTTYASKVSWAKAWDNWVPWEVTRLGSVERYGPRKTALRLDSCQQKEPGRGIRTGTWKGVKVRGGGVTWARSSSLKRGLQRTLRTPHWRHS